jgi:hypothetical protein
MKKIHALGTPKTLKLYEHFDCFYAFNYFCTYYNTFSEKLKLINVLINNI